MKDIGFSICIPCYNGRKFLRETLESVRAQRHTNWELIVVEDASPEPSRDIVEEFAASANQQVRYIESDANQGIAKTRDITIENSTNPIIAILDQDDIWLPDHLASIAQCYEDTNADFAFSGYSMFTDDYHHTDHRKLPSADHLRDLRAACFFLRHHVPTAAITFRRQLLKKTGIWSKGIADRPVWLPDRNRGEDRNFLLKVLHSDAVLACTGRITAAYRKHDKSFTGFDYKGLIYKAWYYNRYGLAQGISKFDQRRFLGYLNRHAGDELKANDPRHAAWFYFRAWRWYPVRIDRLFQSIRTILTRGSS